MALPGWRTPGAGLAVLDVGLALLPHARPLRVLGRGQSRCAAGAAAKIVLDFEVGLCQFGRTACTRGQPAKGPPTGLSQLCYCQPCPMQNGPLQRGLTFSSLTCVQSREILESIAGDICVAAQAP